MQQRKNCKLPKTKSKHKIRHRPTRQGHKRISESFLINKELTKLALTTEKKCLPVSIEWLLDEFANCPPLPDIDNIVSVARSRGMRFQFFIQSFSQLDNVYGKEVAQIILDNCGLCYLKTNTQSTAETISKRLGKATIEEIVIMVMNHHL